MRPAIRGWRTSGIKPLLSAGVSSLLLAILAAPGADAREPAAAASGSGAKASVNVTDLRTEYAHNPLGIDERRPRLSWILASSERGQAQTAYKVQVATSPSLLRGDEPDVWDSDKVKSPESVNVAYSGPALRSATRYWWRVRVWDADGRPSGWSEPARWEMAKLDGSDWSASWIGRGDDPVSDDLTFDGSDWIWFPELDPAGNAPAGTRYFRATFDVPEARRVTRARMLLTADDQFSLHVNGERRAETPEGALWWDAQLVDVTSAIHPGRNVVGIAATNRLNNGRQSPAGAIGRLVVEFDSGEALVIPTDAAWRSSAEEHAGWTEENFDDSAWTNAHEVAPFGQGPWTCCGGVRMPEYTGDPLLRKTFQIAKPVREARIYMSGLGYHELRLNGQKVGDRLLETDVNDYEERVGYSTYDVTPYLTQGENAIGAMLGRGFFDVHQWTPLDWHLAPWRDEPKLLFQMEIRYADGSVSRVVSDETWKTAESPITHDSVFGGEDYDARLEQAGWDTPSFDGTHWRPAEVVDEPGGRLVATNNDPVKVAETLRARSVSEPKPGVYVLDLGKTITGWGRLNVSGARGTTITMRYGQKLLADGTVDYHNGWHGGRSQTDRYTLKGQGTETWEPRFSFKSFRYLQVSGLPAAPTAETVVARSIHSDVKDTGGFDSSNDLYNTLHDGMTRTILGSLQGYPAIDPFYEKSGWTEDVFVTAQSMIYQHDLARFFEEWLEDIRDSQLPDGHIPIIVPSPGWGYTSWGTPSPVWTAVYPIMAWRLYENYGDRRLLARHYPAIKRYLDREVARLEDGIVAEEFLGDWLAPGFAVPPEDTRLAGTAYVYRQLEIVADMARALGLAADAAHFSERAEFVRDRFNATFLNEDEGHYQTATDPNYRQTSNLLPLAFGMVPEDYEDSVFESVAADVRARGNHLDTGTLGTEVLLRVLSDHGEADLAHAVANQSTYPSWGHWFANGADTMWESWDLNSRSRVHFFLGTIDQWFIEDVAGLSADAPGFRRITIRPRPGEELDEAKGTYESVYGEIESDWEANDDAFELDVAIPVSTTATVYIPAAEASSVTESGRPADRARGVRFLRMDDEYAVFAVGSGDYRFRAARSG
jgi:alpha-L-rhamnosidase